MSGYSWLGILVSATGTTLALASYFVMAMPYFDNAPFLVDLKKNTRLAIQIGLAIFALFFGIFYLGARYLDQNTSGPLLVFGGFVVALPISMLIGTETWDHYNPRLLNKLSGLTAVALATAVGLTEIGGTVIILTIVL